MSGSAGDLIVRVSSSLLEATPEDEEVSVRHALELVRAWCGADRVYTLELSSDLERFRCQHDACAADVSSVRERFRDIPIAAFPYGFGKLARGEIVCAASADALPPEARAEAAAMRANDIVSFLTVPLVARDRVLGGIGVDWVRSPGQWTDETIQTLRIVGSLLATTLRRVSAERERRQIDDRLRQAERLESLGLLAGGVAHDFNNLLVGIVNFVDNVRRSPELPQTLRDDLDRAREAIDRAADLTRKLLAFGRRTPGAPPLIELNRVVSSTLELLRRVLPATVEIDFIPGHDLGTVAADPGEVEQVLSNLCMNAVDAMDGRGRITIETENVVLNGQYVRANPWARRGRYVLLTVTDTGRGMSADVRARLFEPFFTTKPPGKGTGLGLSIVYGAIQRIGGLIHVYSEVGRGATFKVYFPIAARLASRIGTKITGNIDGGTETVLVAEDNDLVARVVQRVLEHAGYRVLIATNGREARSVFEQRVGAIDIALLDAMLPDMTGREVADELLARRPDLPILYASGYSPDALRDWLRPEIDGFVEKPYDADGLLLRVRESLDRARARRSADGDSGAGSDR
ncbi:MAG: ATP-binding protein [Myxococcota bacterium]|nr:ATP-binding protein [Myxococcota bacterium]